MRPWHPLRADGASMCAPHKSVVRRIVYWPASLHSPNAPAPLLLPSPAPLPKRCNPLKCDGQCSSTPTMAAGHALAQPHWHPWLLWWCRAHPPTQGQGWMPLEQSLLRSATHSSMRAPAIITPRFSVASRVSGLPPREGLSPRPPIPPGPDQHARVGPDST